MDVVAALQQKIDLYDSYEAIAVGLPVQANSHFLLKTGSWYYIYITFVEIYVFLVASGPVANV